MPAESHLDQPKAVMNSTPSTRTSSALLAPLTAALLSAMPALAAEYTNATSLTLPAFHSGPGPADVYPSTIEVSGLTGQVGKVAVTLHNITIDRPDDLEVLLVAPDGSHLVILGDAGGISFAGQVTITLDDMAQDPVPDTGPLVTGIFQPTSVNSSSTTFPLPAPSGPYPHAAPAGPESFASVFNGLNPNGTWSLYVADDVSSGTSYSIAGGWSLTLLTSPPLNYISPGTTNGNPLIQFTGLAGQSYIVQKATVVTGPYVDIPPALTAGFDGLIQYEDTIPPTTPARYYRVRTNP